MTPSQYILSLDFVAYSSISVDFHWKLVLEMEDVARFRRPHAKGRQKRPSGLVLHVGLWYVDINMGWVLICLGQSVFPFSSLMAMALNITGQDTKLPSHTVRNQ